MTAWGYVVTVTHTTWQHNYNYRREVGTRFASLIFANMRPANMRLRGNLISWEPGHHPGNLLVILWRYMHELPFMNGNILLKFISYCREISEESSQQATSLIWNGNTSHDRTRSCICYVSCLFEFNDNWSKIHTRSIDTMRFWYPNGWLGSNHHESVSHTKTWGHVVPCQN